MNHKRLLTGLGLAVLAMPSLRGQSSDRLIFPDPANEIWIVRASPAGAGLPSGTRLPEADPLAAKILTELRLPFHHSVIRLSQCARNLAGSKDGPNVLYLSGNEGGFAPHGLSLVGGDKTASFPELNFVDLVLDEDRLAEGGLSIYSHELGHVMMSNVWKSFPESESVKQHVSMGITDFAMAFYEGWGEHFQRLALEAIPAYRTDFEGSFDYRVPTLNLWHSRIDEDLRVSGVLRNEYIWQKMAPAAGPDPRDLETSLLLEHTFPVFDRLHLKNAQQMLSCEGVLATLFYRIATNPALGGRYADAAFYERFLLSPIPAGLKPQDIFSPYENVTLKVFWVWHRLNAKGTLAKSPFVEFLEGWIQAFPEDKDVILGIFLSTTAGRTVSRDLGGAFERAAFSGTIGDYAKYRDSAGAFNKALAEAKSKVLSGETSVDACVGPEIWITNADFLIRTTLWNAEEKKPLRVNLNTCSTWDLMTFPGITREKADQIIAAREKAGYFRSLEESRIAGFAVPTSRSPS
jgi:hypothetical protein